MNNLILTSGVQGYLAKDGTAWVNAEDVARGFGFTQKKKGEQYVRWETVNNYLESFGYSQPVGKGDYLPENMVYRLGFKANNEAARNFQAKLADEIIPSIRKNGGYMVTTENDTPELIMARAFILAKETIENHERKIKELEVIKKNQSRQIETMQPKADFYDTIMGTDKAVEMKDVAKILDMGIGRNNLFKFLKEHKVLDKNNCPYQLYVDKRWFKSIPVYFDDPYTGKPSIYLKTVVYPAGIDGIRQMLRQKGFKKNVAQDHDYITSKYR